MPTICVFYGITIIMHLTDKEHNPPHIHAIYGEYEASFYIETGDIFEGFFPSNGKKLVKEFVNINKTELLNMWDTGIYKKLEPIK